MAEVQVSEELQVIFSSINLLDIYLEKLHDDDYNKAHYSTAVNILINAKQNLKEKAYEYLHSEEL